MKIGIIGGTFDPIHFGHLILAERIRLAQNLDRVIFLPTGNSVHKRYLKVSDSKDRFKMCQLAIEDNPYFEISDIEYKREGYTYTYDTILELEKIYPNDDIYFIIGSDILFSIGKWKNVDEVFKKIKFLLALRSDYDKNIDEKISYFQDEKSAEIILKKIPLVDISSSEIRELVKNNKSIKYLVPKCIEDYIREKELYKE